MRRPILFLAVARSALEAVIFACPAAVLHQVTAGRDPLPLGPALLLIFGASLVLVAALRDARAGRQSAALTLTVVGGAIALGLLQPSVDGDGLATLTRIVGFGILGEAFVWRTLGVARSVTRWSDARTAALLAAVSLAIGTAVPGLDGGPLPAASLVSVAAAGLALSIARSTEELDLAGQAAHGTASGRTAAGTAFVLGGLAVLAAVLAPSLRALAAAGGDVIGPVVERVVYLLALPFGYLAAWLVPLFRPLAQLIFGRREVVPPPRDGADERLMLEALEQTRPFVFGAAELLLALVAVVVGVVLVDRLTRERRSALPEGATLERSAAEGVSLRDTLRLLLPQRGVRRTRPKDDGSRAAEVRLLYWRFLETAERAGADWRSAAETPSEHHARLRAADGRWAAARPIVEAFERVRYGEEDPPATLVSRARTALAEVASRPG